MIESGMVIMGEEGQSKISVEDFECHATEFET